MRCRLLSVVLLTAVGLVKGVISAGAQNAKLLPAETPQGYVARLLINETAFPGERGYRGESDSASAMLAMLWVLHGRIHHVPEGYTQREIASVESRSLIDVITAGGTKGQFDGFYRDGAGRFRASARVHRRVGYLMSLANAGAPGPVARLLNYAQGLASAYTFVGPGGPDLFEGIKWISSTPVTGRSYAWMTDSPKHSPGGRFVKIPNSLGGVLGGNRFYTLREAP